METKGPTLEEIARIFDGPEAQVGLADIKEVPGLPIKHNNQTPLRPARSEVQLQDWRSGPGPEMGFGDIKESHTPPVRYDYRKEAPNVYAQEWRR